MIFRVNKTKGFSVMSNHHLKDKNISLKAKGLLSLMLSLPDDWNYSVAGLAAQTKENESAIKSALDELKAAHYVVVTKLLPNQTKSKRIEWLYDIYEQPTTEQPPEVQPIENQPIEVQPIEVQGIEVQSVENQPQQNTKELNTKEQNTKKESKKVSSGNNARAKEPSFDEILDKVDVVRQNPELREAFINFIKMRKVIKAPLTNRGLALAINRAFEIAKGQPEKMIAVVDQSIERSWRGIFPITDSTIEPKLSRQQSVNPYTEMLKEEGYYD